MAHLYYKVGHSIFTPFQINSSLGNCRNHDHKFCQLCFCRLQAKSLIFCPILTNFLPTCRAQNVDSAKGHGAGKKRHGTGEKKMAQRHS